MALIDEKMAAKVKTTLSKLQQPVALTIRPRPESEASNAMEELLTELAGLSDKISVARETTTQEMESSVTDIAVSGAPTGMRYFGFPGGHEFGVLLEALVAASSGEDPKVNDETRSLVERLDRPLHLEVFVTPT